MPIRKRFEAVQSRKTVNGTAAPGALLETVDGSIAVLPFEQWPFYQSNQHVASDNEVLDARFKQRLMRLYPKLKKLVRVPENEIKHNFALKDTSDGNDCLVLKGRYFPEWAYCPISRQFKHIKEWQTAWNAAGPNSRNKPRDSDNFNPPQSTVSRRDDPKLQRNQSLEQIRFVLAGPNGELADVPWYRWVFAQKPTPLMLPLPSGQKMRATVLDFAKELPDPTSYCLYYEVQERAGDLGSITLTAKKDGGREVLKDGDDKPYRANLAGLYSLRVSRADLVSNGLLFGQKGKQTARPGDEFIMFRAVIRSSNSMYYANSLDSLFIPTKLAQLSTSLLEDIERNYRELHKEYGIAPKPALLLRMLGETGKALDEGYITQLIADNFKFTEDVDNAAERMYRQAEFAYFTDPNHDSQTYPTDGRKPEMSFRRVNTVAVAGIASVSRVDKLKVITVQPSYTRLTPLPADAVLQVDRYSEERQNEPISYEEGNLPRKQFVTEAGLETPYLPAYESYGEGIFLRFDTQQLQEWEKMPGVRDQVKQLVHNHGQTWQARDTEPPTAAQVLIHTFSHLLMRELEFRCGYPLTSLKERLYVGPTMQGLLIYTVAGAAGSFGGLVSLCDDGQLQDLVLSALYRATDCAADPICWQTNGQGQGVGGLNLAACASCALLPETSCEEFNSLLDRRLVVDNTFSYFRELLRDLAG